MKTSLSVAAATAGVLVLAVGGATTAHAYDAKVGTTSCQSSQDVVSRGDSTAGWQKHVQWLTTSGGRQSKDFPYKAYRHVDYANWGYSTANWRIESEDAATLYHGTTYGYCVS